MSTDYYLFLENTFTTIVGFLYRLVRCYVILLIRPFYALRTLPVAFTDPHRREVGPITAAGTASFIFFFVLGSYFLYDQLSDLNIADFFQNGPIPNIGEQQGGAIVALVGAVAAVLTVYLTSIGVVSALSRINLFADFSDLDKLKEHLRTTIIYSLTNVMLSVFVFALAIWAIYMEFGFDVISALDRAMFGPPQGTFGWLRAINLLVYAMAGIMCFYAVLDGFAVGRLIFNTTLPQRHRIGAIVLVYIVASGGLILSPYIGWKLQSAVADFAQARRGAYMTGAQCYNQGDRFEAYIEIRNNNARTLILTKNSFVVNAETNDGRSLHGDSVGYKAVHEDAVHTVEVLLPSEKKSLFVEFTATEINGTSLGDPGSCAIALLEGNLLARDLGGFVHERGEPNGIVVKF